VKTVHKNSAFALVIALGAFVLAPRAAVAFEPQLEKAVGEGKSLFAHNTFGGNGKVCESCHLAGGREPGRLPNGTSIPSLSNAAAIFPRYRAKDNRVVTLEDQVQTCVANALQGTPPVYGSVEMNALVSYITSLSQGKAMDMGGKPQ